MKKILIVFVLMCALCIGGAINSFAGDTMSLLDEIQKRGLIKVGMYLQYPPMEYRDPVTKEPKGLEVDIANLLAKDLGVKLEIVDMEWKAIIPGLLAKKYDVIIAGMSRTPKRNLAVAMTSNNLEEYATMALARIDDPRTTIADFNKKGVVVTCLQGSATEATSKRLFPKAEIKPLQMNPAVLEVQSRRADLVVVSNLFSYKYIRQNPGNVKVLFEDQPLANQPSAIGLRKGDQIFLNWLDNWIRYQRDQRTLQGLIDKWVVKGGE
jgi:polar amino acid transport system substrate-binding protein